MEPEYALNRSYWDSPDDCLEEWLAAYKEIARRHPELRKRVKMLTNRINTARRLFAGLANLGSTPDETVYAYRVEQQNKFYKKAEALDGDFPFGDEQEVFTARYLFSIREMAYIQVGLTAEINPADLSEVPRGKIYTIGDPRELSDDELEMRRRAFLGEMEKTHFANR